MTESQIRKLLRSAPNDIDKFIAKYCGMRLGRGNYRDAYIFKPNDLYVVKIERDMSHASFVNVREWANWIDYREFTRFSAWLAPCIAINETGQILIQARVNRNIDLKDKGLSVPKWPTKIPALFTDKKRFNFGWRVSDNRFVCFDYAFFILQENNFKLKKVNWR